MSLRDRLILIALVVIVAVVGSLQFTWDTAQDDWLERRLPQFQDTFYRKVLNFAYAPEVADGVEVVRRILRIGPDEFRSYFSDALIANGPSPDVSGSVDLNPMGASHRDRRTFPLDRIRAGIRTAMTSREVVLVGTGFCVPIEAKDEVVGGAWLEPIVPPPAKLPLAAYLLPLLVGGLLFGLVVYTLIERGIVKPLRDLGDVAAGVANRDSGVRARLAGARELDRFIDAFNRMAERVEGHRDELEREVRHATETAEKRQTALLRSARLASMGTLAAGIAHEINNPIGGMLNAARRLRESEALGERDRRYVALISEGLERVRRITRRVLDFSPRKLESAPFTVAAVIEGARALAEHRFKAQNVELRLDLAPDLPRLFGDEHEFQQVVLNVIINSLDVLDGREGERWIEVRAVHEDEWLVLTIRDNGPGMSAADLPFVMDPFYSGKGRPDASGLGMFISHQIIDNHGGVLEADSTLGEGFTVTIRMPTDG